MANVSFTKKTWADGSSGGTPITASELNRMEQGIKDCADGVNDLGDSLSHKVTASGVSATVQTGSNHPIEIAVEGDSSNVTLYVSSTGIGLWDNTTNRPIGSVDWA